ncbi:response regulator, partial [Streptococcus merionis]|uniref:response regulator n=1 Tax=Streptococcus merionis TaxID=400065 RepID=UPI0026EFC07D
MSLNLLIVDDEYMILEGLKQFLPYEELGIHAIHTAESAQEALKIFQEHAIDIVLTDISMPDKTGLDMIIDMQSYSDKASYIIMSGFQEFEYAKKAIGLGVVDYLIKPINRNDLEQILQRITATKMPIQEQWQVLIQEKISVASFLADYPDTTHLLVDHQKLDGLFSAPVTICGQEVFFHAGNQASKEVLFAEALRKDSEIATFKDKVERLLFYGNASTAPIESVQLFYDQLVPYIESGQFQELVINLADIVQQLSEGTPSVYLTKQFFNQLITKVYHALPQLEREVLEAFILQVDKSTSLRELHQETKQHILLIADRYQYSEHVSDILAIIHQEYQKELTLKTVSEQLYLNTVYLGQI